MKKILIILLILIAGGMGYGLYLFNKKNPSLENVKPDFQLTANELFDAFEKDETAAMVKYENKILEINGIVFSVQKTDSLSNIILAADNALIGGVNCSFNKPDFEAQKGKEVNIKGKCQGYLTDVILNNCTQVKN